MPRGSQELTNARKEEIIDACAALYETMSFRDITIRDISQRTSFSRPSIYNYFQTKEEIFLALLQREHERWIVELMALAEGGEALDAQAFCDRLAGTLARRGCMLKLMSMNLYDMELNSRMENLVDFKRAYANALAAVTACLERFFPAMTPQDRQAFLYAFFPFLFGVYPYTTHTPKQREAMALARVREESHTVYDLVRAFLGRMLCEDQ